MKTDWWTYSPAYGRTAARLRLAGILLVLAATAACGTSQAHPSHTPPVSATSSTVPAAPGGTMPRPSECLGNHEGAYLQQPTGRNTVTPVLLLGHGPRGVVLGAQSNGGICQMVPFARELVARGYHVATFEWGPSNPAAMTAATRALIAHGATRIVVGGFSEGAVIGLGLAPTLGPRIVGVLSVSGGPYAPDGYPTIASDSRFPGPLLLIAARDDTVFPPGTSAAIARKHRGPDQLLLLSGSDHALALLDDEHGPQVRAAIFTFLARVTEPRSR